MTAALFGLLFVKEHLLSDGKCENLVIVMNMLGLGVFNIGYKIMGEVMKFLT